ncbi:hypothetical protein K474DRAFT_1669518 [Panus rudis PR-1116 ss-1]|nr:hypothetical protein K474DRAFT_1669518 [Panus rudis PR-1116 ss-1]
MWSKLTHALKRPGTPSIPGNDDDNGFSVSTHVAADGTTTTTNDRPTDVLAGVYEQHPNLSVFHQEVPFPDTPTSPSMSRKLLRRMSKNALDAPASLSKLPRKIITAGLHHGSEAETLSPSFAKNLPELPRSTSNASETSSNASASIKSPIEGSASLRLPQKLMKSLSNDSEISLPGMSKASFDGPQSLRLPRKLMNLNGSEASLPGTPTDGHFGGSLRSILKPNNTPGTGRSVRFFSRDAYKVITPDISESENSSSFTNTKNRRPTIQEVFAEEPAASSTPPIPSTPPPQLPPINPFDISTEPSTIPMLDAPIELPQNEGSHNRSQSFSFGQTVFHSIGPQSTPRHRALSDTALPAEADINDPSNTSLVLMNYSPEKEKDPFGAHATTYYTAGTVSPSPRSGLSHDRSFSSSSGHTRSASKEEDLIWSLRTQLALQSELCAQFEVDLSARDELVQTLTSRLSESERECERRKTVIRNWRKRVAELEKCVKGLEEEVERSREESVDRSVMDEASGEALRMLHRRIGELERERGESQKREVELKTELEAAKAELQKRDVAERELKDGIRAAKEEMLAMEEAKRQSQLVHASEQLQDSSMSLSELDGHRLAWESEKTELLAASDALRKDQVSLQSQLTDAREDILRKESEISVLKAELEAQWKHTEKMSEEVASLKHERDSVRQELDSTKTALETTQLELITTREQLDHVDERFKAMEQEWNDNDAKKAELENEINEVWNAKEDVEKERDELEMQLRTEQEHADELTRALQEREDRVSELAREHQYANDTISRLQENLRQRDTEIAQQTARIRERELELEELREEASKTRREHARTVDEQSRKLSEVVAREVDARANMESMVREKAEMEVLQATLKDRVNQLQEEVEKLRRQIHELHVESADKDLKLAQAAKQRAQDKEDLQGLNIALDSKQQELELLKRKVTARTSMSSTPGSATTKVATHRRESSIFGTPSVSSRPPSVISDSGGTAKERGTKLSDPPPSKAALGRSVRLNGTSASSTTLKRVEGSMGPPPARRTSFLASSTSSATPTRIPSSSSTTSAASASASRPSSVTPMQKRRSSSLSQDSKLSKPSVSSRESLKSSTISSVSEQDEKENVSTPVTRPLVRRKPATEVPA